MLKVGFTLDSFAPWLLLLLLLLLRCFLQRLSCCQVCNCVVVVVIVVYTCSSSFVFAFAYCLLFTSSVHVNSYVPRPYSWAFLRAATCQRNPHTHTHTSHTSYENRETFLRPAAFFISSAYQIIELNWF